MVKVEKLLTWSIWKEFEAETIEEAIALAKADESDDWQFVGDEQESFYISEADDA